MESGGVEIEDQPVPTGGFGGFGSLAGNGTMAGNVLAGMLNGALGASQGETSGGGTPTLANYAAEDLSWIAVPGLGRVTPEKLVELVNSGRVKETVSKNGTYNYTLVK